MYVLNKHHILIRKLKRQGFCCEIGGKQIFSKKYLELPNPCQAHGHVCASLNLRLDNRPDLSSSNRSNYCQELL